MTTRACPTCCKGIVTVLCYVKISVSLSLCVSSFFIPCAQAQVLRVKQIVRGVQSQHTCALLSNNSVKCFGRNHVGQLGLGDAASRGTQLDDLGDDLPAVQLGTELTILKLTANDSATCALFEDPQTQQRSAKCWGYNSYGALGFAYARFGEPASIWGDAASEMGSKLPFISLPRDESLSDIALGREGVCLLTNRRQLRCVSRDEPYLPIYSRVPTATGTDQDIIQIAMAPYHACLLFADQRMKCWGSGRDGELGYGPRMTAVARSALAQAPFVATAGPVRKMALGLSRTCALLMNGDIQCWGNNNQGGLGLGVATANVFTPSSRVDLGHFGEVQDIATNMDNGTCALSQQGRVKCWGKETANGDQVPRGAAGTMGDNLPFMDLGNFPVIALAHTCAVFSNGGAKCWGQNQYGQLGIGDANFRGDAASEMGMRLPYVHLWD